MSEDELSAEPLLGFEFFPHQSSPTLGVLRLDTASDQHWFMVDRKTLLKLSGALARIAEELPSIQ